MLNELLKDILHESKIKRSDHISEKIFIENILNNIYQFLYKRGQPVHTVAIGILRGNTFDMYYKGRLLEKHTESFGAMSYDTTIAGRSCKLFKKKGQLYLNLFSRKNIREEFEIASNELKDLGLIEESESLVKRSKVTIDQGVGSFLLMPLYFGSEVIGIFTISSLKESDSKHILGEDIEKEFVPIAQWLSLMLYMEKISYEKAEDMGRLLISSIDAKDEYQASHSLNVRTLIDMFIDELSRDKELRERVESIGLKLTVEKIERLRLAALLHDIGKIFVPGTILRKSDLNKEEILIRKMHPYLTYNILTKSQSLNFIADIASMHHALYYIPVDREGFDEYTMVETEYVCYPFDSISQSKFDPETQIIALADVLNAIVRSRPEGKGLGLSKALDIIESIDHRFHEGLKDIFLTIIRRVEKNLEQGKYLPLQAEEYRNCLWLEKCDKDQIVVDKKWKDLDKFVKKIKMNFIGIVSVVEIDNAKKLIDVIDNNTKINKKSLNFLKVDDDHLILTIINIPKEEGFIWINNIFNFLKEHHFDGKIAFAFIGKSGFVASFDDIYDSLKNGLNKIKNEPVNYYLNPVIYKYC